MVFRRKAAVIRHAARRFYRAPRKKLGNGVREGPKALRNALFFLPRR
jgi:hypothetical protein